MADTNIIYELKGQITAYEKVINLLITHLKNEKTTPLLQIVEEQKQILEKTIKSPVSEKDEKEEKVLKEIKRQIRTKSARKSRKSVKPEDIEKKLRDKKKQKVSTIFSCELEECNNIFDYGKTLIKKKRGLKLFLDTKYKILKYYTIPEYYKKLIEIYNINGIRVLDEFDKRWFCPSDSLYVSIDEKLIDNYRYGFELSFENITRHTKNLNYLFCENFKCPIVCYFNITDILANFDIQLEKYFIYTNSTFYILESYSEDTYNYLRDNELNIFFTNFTGIMIEFIIHIFTDVYNKIYCHNNFIDSFMNEREQNGIEFKQMIKNIYVLSSDHVRESILSLVIKKCSRQPKENEHLYYEKEEFTFEKDYTFESILEQLFTNYRKEVCLPIIQKVIFEK